MRSNTKTRCVQSLIHIIRLGAQITFAMLFAFEQALTWADIRERDSTFGRENLDFVVVRVG